VKPSLIRPSGARADACRTVIALTAASILASCDRSLELFPDGDAQGPNSAGGGNILPAFWGEYADTLDVPPCPDGPVLVVDATTDELDGGDTITDASQAGPTLSLREAIWIASNRPGPDTILFSVDAFPPRDPKTILLSGSMPLNLEQVCIDARGRGVIVDWGPESALLPGTIWPLRLGSLQVGLTMLHMPFEQTVWQSQIAGCRIDTDGTEAQILEWGRPWQLEVADGSLVGPGNTIAGQLGVRVVGGPAEVRIEHNSFGWDPIERTSLALEVSVNFLTGSATIEDNVFGAQGVWNSFDSYTGATIRNNRFGVDREGNSIPIGGSGIGRFENSPNSRFVIGPGNVVRGAPMVAWITPPHVTLTRNSISANDEGIVFAATSPVAPPVVVAASSTEVSGNCASAGTVEVFSDPTNQGEIFLGAAECTATEPWSLAVSVVSGRHVTATLTDADGNTSAFSAPVTVP
jgi:hypothetical protein